MATRALKEDRSHGTTNRVGPRSCSQPFMSYEWLATTGLSNLVDRDPPSLAGLLDQQDQRDQA